MKYTISDLLAQFSTLRKLWLGCETQFDICYLLGMRWCAQNLLREVNIFIDEYYAQHK